MNQSERRLYLINALLDENPHYKDAPVPARADEQKALLRALMNIRRPKEISGEFLKVQDAYLKEETLRKGITDADDLEFAPPGICIWQGDITTLKCDAIVNAANSGLTGCYVPNHRCIDNCIHTYAGMQLRLECAQIMAAQKHPEPAGRAKITKAYNLPCRYILHTVGPVINGRLTKADCAKLASCYSSCLETAAHCGLESIAFCCISTGEFHFPNEAAAEIALESVSSFLKKQTAVKKVIFNVFKDTDKEIYERLLSTDIEA